MIKFPQPNFPNPNQTHVSIGPAGDAHGETSKRPDAFPARDIFRASYNLSACSTAPSSALHASYNDDKFKLKLNDVFRFIFAKRIRPIDILSYVINPALKRWFPIFYPNASEWKSALISLVRKDRMSKGQPFDLPKQEIDDEVLAVRAKITNFRMDDWDKDDEKLARMLHPVMYLENIAKTYPKVAYYGKLLLSRAVQASTLERQYSRTALFQSKLANQMKPERAGSMAFASASRARQNLPLSQALEVAMQRMISLEKQMWELLVEDTSLPQVLAPDLVMFVENTFSEQLQEITPSNVVLMEEETPDQEDARFLAENALIQEEEASARSKASAARVKLFVEEVNDGDCDPLIADLILLQEHNGKRAAGMPEEENVW